MNMIYEIMYIIPSKYSDSEIQGIQGEVNALYAKHGGEVKQEKNLGKIKFTYQIKGFSHGTYILNYVEGEGDVINKIDTELRLADQVLRHIIVKREDGIPTHDVQLAQYQAPINAAGKRVKLKKAGSTVVAEVEEAPVSVDEINEKLDEILGDDTVEGEE
jgi:small subunit ribosomal protein S6